GNTKLVPHARGHQLAADHADRTSDRGLVGEDEVRAASDIVAAATGDVAHRDDEWLLRLHALRRVQDDLAGDGGAAGGIDAQDDRLDRIIAGRLFQRLADLRAFGTTGAERRGIAAAEADGAVHVNNGNRALP